MSATASAGVETAPVADPDSIQLPGVGPEPIGPEPRREPTGKRSRGKAGRDQTATGTGATPSPGPRRGPGRPTVDEAGERKRAREVAESYRELAGVALMAAPFWPRGHVLAAVLDSQADALGVAWARWASKSPRIAKMLDSSSFGGGMVGVLLAHGPIVLALTGPTPDLSQLDPEAQQMAAGMMAGLAEFMRGAMAPDAPPTA